MPTDPRKRPVSIQLQTSGVQGGPWSFEREVQLGRATECEVQVEAEMVSRVHARVVFSDGDWWLQDEDSTNGTYSEGEAIDHILLSGVTNVQLGRDGPVVQIEVSADGEEVAQDEHGSRTDVDTSSGATTAKESKAPSPTSPSAVPPRDGSVSQYIQHYFETESQEAGEHTRMIQKAYQKAQARQRRKYLGILAGVVVLCLFLSGYALIQHLHNSELRDQAQEVFAGMKKQEVLIAQLKRSVEAAGNSTLEKRLANLEKQREKQKSRYEGYVEELGLHRNLTAKEREIYRVARLFGESEFSIPAGFVRRVKQKIRNHWQGPAREDFVRAIRRAERKGYTSFIVNTLQKHNLPPELFYLALQESRFDPKAVGPRTRWGIAKGTWQFIPKTARKYGLQLGPRVDQRVPDPQDERHDFKLSTRAAAQYLQTIYSTRAQASGLLVVASYNWGEHRIVEKMENLPGPQQIPEEAMQGVPEDPSSRNYWQFLTTYEERMPAETKDYVLKIFSAAVIGQAPELFGFSFENPLQKHLEADTVPAAVSDADQTQSIAQAPVIGSADAGALVERLIDRM